ncbi:hypothetical protein WN48_09852 [Eufriesea mexicana]|nr:hypothetical protein WN48_09852 [Eufriesea mexicana]
MIYEVKSMGVVFGIGRCWKILLRGRGRIYFSRIVVELPVPGCDYSPVNFIAAVMQPNSLDISAEWVDLVRLDALSQHRLESAAILHGLQSWCQISLLGFAASKVQTLTARWILEVRGFSQVLSELSILINTSIYLA